MSIFQDLHDSDIGFKIEVPYNGMFGAQIGTERGFPHAEAVLSDWQTLEYWLREKAIQLYPDSPFAAKYRSEAL